MSTAPQPPDRPVRYYPVNSAPDLYTSILSAVEEGDIRIEHREREATPLTGAHRFYVFFIRYDQETGTWCDSMWLSDERAERLRAALNRMAES